jgi:glucosamine--fructose-6-phosphate aminotransferase (isomerizing)
MMAAEIPPYVADILSQGRALRQALSRFDPGPLASIAEAAKDGAFDRIILTGMGASFYALYPTWLHLTRLDLPVMWLDAAELLHYAAGQLTGKSLLWIVSQSGRSAEIVALLDEVRQNRPAGLMVTTNDLSSPLAETVLAWPAHSALIPINAEPEISVSTRTYLNALAFCQLGARALSGEDLSPSQAALEATTDAVEAYLGHWQEHKAVIGGRLGHRKNLVLVGRGSSLAAVYCGALIIGEASKQLALGLPAGQFRHGLLELCGPELSVIVFAGPEETRHLNQRLAADVQDCGGRVFWLGPEEQGHSALPMPAASGIGLPLAEILPIQLLTIHLAEQSGLVPGKFKYIGKVTLQE